jgi:acyl phosphate:glycerol-3-phosphate acyltransferase
VWPALVLLAYLSGSVPYGQMLAKGRGVDIQQHGSGNIGATNVSRVLGKRLGALVLLLDAAKGALVVGLSLWLASRGHAPSYAVAASGLAAVAGHCFPVWLRFRGGKGVATALGVFVVIDPLAAGASVALFALVYALTRVASVGSLVAALAFPFVLLLRGRPWLEVALAAAIFLIILVRHRENLTRLRRGKELGV